LRSLIFLGFFTALFIVSRTVLAGEFIGSDSCMSCHQDEYQLWQGSHHDLAMQLPTADTVLGNFDNQSFTYNGITSRFYQRDGKYLVETDGEDGKLQEFEVAYVFGVDPLQQYLLPLTRGRLQALSIAWDARPATAGGQRWYHLYPDESIDSNDPLHWTGPYQNWNTRCAECHSTDLQKNYDASTRSFDTHYAEIDVGCEACHGPAEKHLELAQSNTLAGTAKGGFDTALKQRGDWAFSAEGSIASRQQPLQSRAQIDSCGRCHSRRGTLGDYHYGADLLDTHRLSLPQSPLYHHDGQILDEVYVYGSFVQSRMHQAGVVCSNCHEPHSLKLRAPNNGVCAQCHKTAVYDTADHHRHAQDSSGALCANCHMPETTYMGVDPRRDHSMRIPRPDLSEQLATPNACNQCHTDKDANWASAALGKWGVTPKDSFGPLGQLFQRAAFGDNQTTPLLAEIASDDNRPLIWRATAMETLGQMGGRDALQTATQLLYSDEPQLRVSTIRAIEFLPLHQRYQLLQALFDDPVTSVRMEIASSLAAVPLDQIPAPQAKQLQALFDEYLSTLQLHADMPSIQMQIGLFVGSRGDAVAAEAAYREALYLNRQLIGGYLNLADLLRALGREEEARSLLLEALQQAPSSPDVLHSLGLLETRTGNAEKALQYLGAAAEQETTGGRHRYVYAIALHDLGQPRQAISQLQELYRLAPDNQEVLLALANYSAEAGQMDRALYYAEALVRIAPRNQGYQQLYNRLASPPAPLRPQ
jgi:tetratricopeptide (TPR) repeat protein